MVHSKAQTEYYKETPITHEHLTLVRPKTPFLPVDSSEILLSRFAPKGFFGVESLCPAHLLTPRILIANPRLSDEKNI